MKREEGYRKKEWERKRSIRETEEEIEKYKEEK